PGRRAHGCPPLDRGMLKQRSMPIIGLKSARLPHGALEIPSHIFGYVLAESGWHQLALAVLTAIVFLLEIVPLELQRRIINDLAKDRNFRFVILLCVAYGGTVLVQGGTKAIVNIYRSWVAERATRDLRRQVHLLVSSTSAASSTLEAEGVQASMIVSEVESIGSFTGSTFSERYCKAASCVRSWPIWSMSISGWGWRRFCCFCRNLSLCRSCRGP